MLYQLMHDDLEVADLDMDEQRGMILDIIRVHDRAHMPMGTVSEDGSSDVKKLDKWWSQRGIPTSRSGIRSFFESLDVCSVRPFLVCSMGLSLSDHYWIRLLGSEMGWKDVNFFDNDFSDDVGDPGTVEGRTHI